MYKVHFRAHYQETEEDHDNCMYTKINIKTAQNK